MREHLVIVEKLIPQLLLTYNFASKIPSYFPVFFNSVPNLSLSSATDLNLS